jgi:hypothetical protein
MTPAWESAALRLVSDLRDTFSERLRSVVAYGPHLDGDTRAPLTCLALVTELTLTDLESCARRAGHWERQGIGTPLILPQGEFFRSLDAFPLEYGEIIRAHQRVFGGDPFEGVTITREDLRRAVETQVKSHLLHLREGFIEAGGRPAVISDLVASSAAAFTALLRHVAWLNGSANTDRVQAAREGAQVARISETLVSDMLALDRGGAMQATDSARLMPEYLAAVEQLARTVDAWHEQASGTRAQGSGLC